MRRFTIYTIIIFLSIIITFELYVRIYGNYCESWFDINEKIVKRKSNTEGKYKTEFTNTGYFKINNAGWNSHRDYYCRKESENCKLKIKKFRIAIVGHSNIEGLRIPIDKTLSKILEDDLNQKGIPTEVYTFGFGGMHLAQAMHISRYAVRKFQPDILIIGTMLNDFWMQSTNKKNFLNLAIDENGIIHEIVPRKFTYNENSLFRFFYFSKCIYYFDQKIMKRKWKIKIINKKAKPLKKKIRQEKFMECDWKSAYQHILFEFSKITRKGCDGQIPIFFLKLPCVIPSYNYDYKEHQVSVNKKKNLLEKLLYENMFTVIELEKAFSNDYIINSQKFDFENDYHYNIITHKLIGEELARYIQLYLESK